MGSLFVIACAVCGAGEDDPSRGSYVWMSMIISLLPLALLGGIVGYVVWKTRAAALSERGEKQPE
jgi:MYXO-CTERM domain-containing protein